jgi:ABC-type glycerol-3-phosphate transport system substrate-binding protein
MDDRIRSLRRASTATLLSTAIGAAIAVGTAPAAAAATPYPGCLDPIDGVTVCTLAAKGPINESIGQIEATGPGVTIEGVLLVLERCVGEDCSVVAVETGSGTAVHTATVRGVPGGHFVTTASWVDDLGRQHHGVRTG